MAPRASPVWQSRARSVPVPVPVQAHDTNANANINTNSHIHILLAPKFVNSSISISTPTPISAPSTSTSTDPTPTQTSSLWSSSYASGTGVKIAGMIDAGLILILLIFLGVIFLQWKRRTGSVPSTPSKNNPKAGGRDQTQGKDAAVLIQVDSHGNDKEKIGTPTLVAESGSASETEHDNGNMRRS